MVSGQFHSIARGKRVLECSGVIPDIEGMQMAGAAPIVEPVAAGIHTGFGSQI